MSNKKRKFMKNLILVLVGMVMVFTTSCEKEEVVQPQPQPIVVQGGDYDKYVLMADMAMGTDSIRINNITKNVTEVFTDAPSEYLCSGITSHLHTCNLSNTMDIGDVVSVTFYHSGFTWGGLTYVSLPFNDNLVVCDEVGSNTRQTDNGGSTTIQFIVD